MSPMFSLHSGPTLPLSVPDINAFFSHFGVIMFFRKDPPQTEALQSYPPRGTTTPGGARPTQDHTRHADEHGVVARVRLLAHPTCPPSVMAQDFFPGLWRPLCIGAAHVAGPLASALTTHALWPIRARRALFGVAMQG